MVATTRSRGKLDELRAMGAEAVVMDGLDAVAVGEVVARTAPEVLVHQMTALNGAGSLRRFDREFAPPTRCGRPGPTTCSRRLQPPVPAGSSRRATPDGRTFVQEGR